MIVYGVQQDPNDVDVNPCTQLCRHERHFRDRIALHYEGQTFTYAEFTKEVRRWAAHFVDAGVNSGDRIGYIGQNSRSFLFAMFGAWWIGAAFMPFNFRLSAPETAKLFLLGTPHLSLIHI